MALRMKHHLGAAMGELRFEPVVPRIRAYVDGRAVVDSTRVALVWEPRRLIPVYAVPGDDLVDGSATADPQPAPPDLAELPRMLGPTNFGLHTTPGTVLDVRAGDRVLPAAGFRPDDAHLDGRVLLDFDAFDHWLEEDQPRPGHAHDPFKRITVLATSRHVVVSLGGQVLAESRRPVMLVETHLPVRYYLPAEDVRLDLLVPSATRTTCAYKGHAAYLSIPGVADDICWRYDDPLDDAMRVRGHLCFWSERTDLTVDGVPVPRPVTPWSTPEEQAAADPSRLEFG